MAKKYPGLYLYFDWLKNLERLPREVAMEMVLNLYHYSEEQREPTPLSEPQYEIVQDMLLDQMKRSMRKSESNRRAALRKTEREANPFASPFELTDEELLELFETDDHYENEDPHELLRLQRTIYGPGRQGTQSSELHTSPQPPPDLSVTSP